MWVYIIIFLFQILILSLWTFVNLWLLTGRELVVYGMVIGWQRVYLTMEMPFLGGWPTEEKWWFLVNQNCPVVELYKYDIACLLITLELCRSCNKLLRIYCCKLDLSFVNWTLFMLIYKVVSLLNPMCRIFGCKFLCSGQFLSRRWKFYGTSIRGGTNPQSMGLTKSKPNKIIWVG